MLIAWYKTYWCALAPVLPLIQLRDEFNIPIDGRREIKERCP
jgi:hypothetical protein